MSEATSHTLHIMSSIDPLAVAAAQHHAIMACFILADGTKIWYKPESAGGPWKPITETCGKGET